MVFFSSSSGQSPGRAVFSSCLPSSLRRTLLAGPLKPAANTAPVIKAPRARSAGITGYQVDQPRLCSLLDRCPHPTDFDSVCGSAVPEPPLHDCRTIGFFCDASSSGVGRLSYPDAAAATPVRAMLFYPLFSMASLLQTGSFFLRCCTMPKRRNSGITPPLSSRHSNLPVHSKCTLDAARAIAGW